MRKSSKTYPKRVSNIRKLLKREKLKQKDLCSEDILNMEPTNFSRIMCSEKVPEDICRVIADHFPIYNLEWLLGDSETMLKADLQKDYVSRTDATNAAALTLLDSALREVCAREGMDPPTLDNIPELLLLQAQLRDYADALMWNYVKHREHSHVWNFLDQK